MMNWFYCLATPLPQLSYMFGVNNNHVPSHRIWPTLSSKQTALQGTHQSATGKHNMKMNAVPWHVMAISCCQVAELHWFSPRVVLWPWGWSSMSSIGRTASNGWSQT